MGFTHPCFISYTNPSPNKLFNEQIEAFYEAIQNLLASDLQEHQAQPYLDREKLSAGDYFNHALGKALCGSACMIMLYSADYFNSSYCLGEYNKMCELESQRREYLPKDKSLVIPILLCRSRELLPQQLRQNYQRTPSICNEFRYNNQQDLMRKLEDEGVVDNILECCANLAQEQHLFDECEDMTLNPISINERPAELCPPPPTLPTRR